MTDIPLNQNIKYSVIHIIDKELKQLFKVEQNRVVSEILLENRWTDFLQTLVDFGNTSFLRNFQFRLEMEEQDGVS
jgi:hypothetical protein